MTEDNTDHFHFQNWISPECPKCGSGNVEVVTGYDQAFRCEDCDAEVWF